MVSRQNLLEQSMMISSEIDKLEKLITLVGVEADIETKTLELRILKLYRDKRVLDQQLYTTLL